MDIKNTLPVTAFRKNIFKIVDRVFKIGERFIITDKGRPKAVIMSAEEYESWIETFAVMKEFPNLDKEIEKARSDYKKGNYVTLDQIIKKRQFMIADKSEKKYDVIRSSFQKKFKTISKN